MDAVTDESDITTNCLTSVQVTVAAPAPGPALPLLGQLLLARGLTGAGAALLALDADVLLQGHEGDTCLGEGVEDGDDLTQRSAEPGEFADDPSRRYVRQAPRPQPQAGRIHHHGESDERGKSEYVFWEVGTHGAQVPAEG